MTLLSWAETDRETLRATVPDAVVLIPIGATEQHGPTLATGTDHLIAEYLTRRAAEVAHPDSSRTFVITPVLAIGASDHHLPFGGTLSVSPSVLLGFLTDLLDGLARQGARRVVLINGHGGNTGVCHAAAATAAGGRTDRPIQVFHIDYWNLLPEGDRPDGRPVPGHAGVFESSLLTVACPHLRAEPAIRPDPPAVPDLPGVGTHRAEDWQRIEGHTDDAAAATADIGAELSVTLTTALADRLCRIGSLP